MCDNCEYYKPILFKILIIKLDAVGDVLRTTTILPPLKSKYPDAYIIWCTKNNSKELFRNNHYVDEIITVEDDAWFRLSKEEFDIIINLDSSKISSSIASYAKGKDKKGFFLDEKGCVLPISEEADYWLQMSAFDEKKKANKKTYQQIIYNIIGVDNEIHTPQLFITQKLKSQKKTQLEKHGYSENKLTIGLNVGVGTRWPNKGWVIENWNKLIELLSKENYNLLLLGGREEKNIIFELGSKFGNLIDTGFDNSIHEFAAIVDICDIVITADTFALHIATAFNKKIIALFGPTSMNEVELYGKGIKLHSEDECNCFYQKECTEDISCMQKISAEQVYSALELLINEV
ncbi:MAG: glycosyltransferase family 9 protein [Ignavibacteria bacterium]|nr:glycosyltransferase family 9 protein [Ignavibacteria bacterium]